MPVPVGLLLPSTVRALFQRGISPPPSANQGLLSYQSTGTRGFSARIGVSLINAGPVDRSG